MKPHLEENAMKTTSKSRAKAEAGDDEAGEDEAVPKASCQDKR
jgi:hypothetical protein